MSRVVVATVPDRAAAEILVEMFGEVDIEAAVEPRAGDAYLGSAQGVAFAVLVDGDDEAAARAMLAHDEDADDTEDVDATSAAGRDVREPAVVLSSWDRRRQTFALLLLFMVPLPLSSYYARAPRLGHWLMIAFVSALVLAFARPWPELFYVALAVKALDAWMGPVILAQRQRRHRPWLRWALVLPLFWGLGYAVHRNVSHDAMSKRAMHLAVEVATQQMLGTLQTVPTFPDVPVGHVAQRMLEHQQRVRALIAQLNGPELDAETAFGGLWVGRLPGEAEYDRVLTIIERRVAAIAEHARVTRELSPALNELAGDDRFARGFIAGLSDSTRRRSSDAAQLQKERRHLALLVEVIVAFRDAPGGVALKDGKVVIANNPAGQQLAAKVAPIEKQLAAPEAAEEPSPN